jgi:hypothetical protein
MKRNEKNHTRVWSHSDRLGTSVALGLVLMLAGSRRADANTTLIKIGPNICIGVNSTAITVYGWSSLGPANPYNITVIGSLPITGGIGGVAAGGVAIIATGGIIAGGLLVYNDVVNVRYRDFCERGNFCQTEADIAAAYNGGNGFFDTTCQIVSNLWDDFSRWCQANPGSCTAAQSLLSGGINSIGALNYLMGARTPDVQIIDTEMSTQDFEAMLGVDPGEAVECLAVEPDCPHPE